MHDQESFEEYMICKVWVCVVFWVFLEINWLGIQRTLSHWVDPMADLDHLLQIVELLSCTCKEWYCVYLCLEELWVFDRQVKGHQSTKGIRK